MLPYMITLVLVFSGLLTGHLLWRRDRRIANSLLQSLKKDNHHLEASLTLAQASHLQLSDRFKRQASQLNVLQRICDELNGPSQTILSSDHGTMLTQKPLHQQLNPQPKKTDTHSAKTGPFDLKVALEETNTKNQGLLKRLENQEFTINKINEQNKNSLIEQEVKHADQVSHLEHRICSQAESIMKTNQHLQDLAMKLNASKKKQLNAESAVIDSDSKISSLNEKIEKLTATCLRFTRFESRTQNLKTENQELKLENQNLQTQNDEHILRQQKLSDQINALKLTSTHSRKQWNSKKTNELELPKTIENIEISNDQLHHERSELSARLTNHKYIPEPDSAILSFAEAMEQRKSKTQHFDSEHQGFLIEHMRRGMLFASPPEKSDNLKFISGITEILEARLNDCGIYTYKQILAWPDGAVAEFSNLLGISESLITEIWKQQAEFLAQPKDRKKAA